MSTASADEARSEVAKPIVGEDGQTFLTQDQMATLEKVFMTQIKRQLDKPLRLLEAWLPGYPQELRANNVEGTVIVTFLVEEDGTTSHFMAEENARPVFQALAINAVRHWKFSPLLRNGRTVREWLRFKFAFRLED